MTDSARPQHDPAALAAAAERLQEAAAPLLARRVPLHEIIELAHAARVYAAEHAADLLAAAEMPASSPTYRGAAATVGNVKAAPLPLVSKPSAAVPDHEHVWVTALDENGEPARDADGKTWTHCGVCSALRSGAESEEG